MSKRLVVTASEDGTGKIWAYNDKMVKFEADLSSHSHALQREGAEGHSAGITCMAVSPDSSTIMTGSKDKLVKIWNTEGVLLQTLGKTRHGHKTGDDKHHLTSDAKHSFAHTDFINHVEWHQGGSWVVTSSDDGNAILWNADKGTSLGKVSHQEPVVMAHPEPGRLGDLLTCSYDGTACLWDRASLRAKKWLPNPEQKESGHQGAVWSAYMCPKGDSVLTASQDQTIKIWDIKTGMCQKTCTGHTDMVLHAVWNPQDGNQFFSCSLDNTARIWDMREDSPSAIVLSEHKAAVWSAVFGKDPNTLMTASHDMTALVYDQRLRLPKNSLAGHTGILWHASFSPDDQWVVTCSEDTTARVWNLQTGARRPPCHILRVGSMGHTQAVTCAAFVR